MKKSIYYSIVSYAKDGGSDGHDFDAATPAEALNLAKSTIRETDWADFVKLYGYQTEDGKPKLIAKLTKVIKLTRY